MPTSVMVASPVQSWGNGLPERSDHYTGSHHPRSDRAFARIGANPSRAIFTEADRRTTRPGTLGVLLGRLGVTTFAVILGAMGTFISEAFACPDTRGYPVNLLRQQRSRGTLSTRPQDAEEHLVERA